MQYDMFKSDFFIIYCEYKNKTNNIFNIHMKIIISPCDGTHVNNFMQLIQEVNRRQGMVANLNLYDNSVHLTNADKEAILGGNLIRILKLSQEVQINYS